ncbi:uncharacterized protein VP01_8844g1 [Puccinia sorghi]|uniref:CCHC-type domain-containing protein n=1 Tax=Puccinia sorghi TaxID=27349 RepID=A0A0L6U8D3_9BASI|nr:uncharacterized protein VP01_8844g1 [Puccinia sorghi]
MVFDREPVVFSEFIHNFESSFFDHDLHHRAEVAWWNLCQTGTVLASTPQDFKSHARTVGWANTLLMSLYWHGLKENIQLAMVMRNIEFDSLRSMQAMTLKAGQTVEGIGQGTPAPDPNAMHLSTFQKSPSKQLSDNKHAQRFQMNLCFCCSQAGHISRGCLNGGWRPQGHQEPLPSAWISKLQEEINWLHANPNPSSPSLTPENAGLSKNGASQA